MSELESREPTQSDLVGSFRLEVGANGFGKIFLNGEPVKRCIGFDVHCRAGGPSKVTLYFFGTIDGEIQNPHVEIKQAKQAE